MRTNTCHVVRSHLATLATAWQRRWHAIPAAHLLAVSMAYAMITPILADADRSPDRRIGFASNIVGPIVGILAAFPAKIVVLGVSR